MRKPLVVFGCIAAFAGCDEAIEPEPDDRIIQLVNQSSERQGILAPVEVTVRVLTSDSVPVVGEPVVFTVGDPGAGLGRTSIGRGWVSAGNAADTVETDSAGQAQQRHWILGPQTQEQRLKVSVALAQALEVSVVAEPGILLIGVWEDVDEQTRAELPSDTFRAHATRKHWVDHALANTTNGEEWQIQGIFNRGSGVDSGWLFHLIPMFARAGQSTASDFQCSGVILSEADLEWSLENGWNSLCPGVLRLVRVEEVPQHYLDRLVEEAEG